MKAQLNKVLGSMVEEEKNYELNLPGFRKKNSGMEKKSAVMAIQDTVILEDVKKEENNQKAPFVFAQSNKEEACVEHEQGGSSKASDELNDENRPELIFGMDTEILEEPNFEQAGTKMEKPVHKAAELDCETTEELMQPGNKRISDDQMEERGALNGAVSIFSERFKKSKPVNSKGNSAGNIINGGIIAAGDYWIYYSNISSGNSLCRMKHDGSEKTGLLTTKRGILIYPETVYILAMQAMMSPYIR
jgi:hypothetical protein